MRERETFETRREAVRHPATRREQPFQHESAVHSYLAGIMYLASRRPPVTPPDEPAQPVDKPASPVLAEPTVPEELCR